MSRWQPNSRERLERAAVSLFADRGYEQTTAAEIAAAAGLTERTFFRHFGDKREVLFAREVEGRALLMQTVAAAPADQSTRSAVAAGLRAVAEQMQPRREDLRRRAVIIAAEPELQERELIKQAAWATSLAQTLTDRDLSPGAARMVAEVAIAVLRVANDLWLAGSDDAQLPALVAEALGQVDLLAGA